MRRCISRRSDRENTAVPSLTFVTVVYCTDRYKLEADVESDRIPRVLLIAHEAPRRVVAITGAGGALGMALSRRLAAEPDTALVLSDVAQESLAATVDAVKVSDSPTASHSRRRQQLRPGAGSRPAGRRAVRPTRRVDQQRGHPVAERAHPQPLDRGLGACVSGQRPRRRECNPGGGARDADTADRAPSSSRHRWRVSRRGRTRLPTAPRRPR